jgi:hypothetical protein
MRGGKFTINRKNIVDTGRVAGTSDYIREEIKRLSNGDIKNSGSIMRLSSLTQNSFDALRSTKSLINAHFSYLIPNKEENTQDKKKEKDPVMFDLLCKIEERMLNKRKEKSNRKFDFLLTKAVKENVSVIVGEGNLPGAAKGRKKQENNRAMDWCARKLVEKLGHGVKVHNGMRFEAINPPNTSHQDPFVYNSTNKSMKCRYTQCKISEISSYDLKRLSSMLKKKNPTGTSKYYLDGVNEFIGHYSLEEYRSDIKNAKLHLEKFCELMSKKSPDEQIIFPQKGGRVYLSTHKLTSGAKEIKYNNKIVYLSDADEIAAINIGLVYLYNCVKFPSKTKNVTDKNNPMPLKVVLHEIEQTNDESSGSEKVA